MTEVVASVRRIAGYGRTRDSDGDRPRDHVYQAAQPRAELPEWLDLRPHCPPVFDQGDLGSCTANAIAAVLALQMVLAGWRDWFLPSRLFIFYNTHTVEGVPSADTGASVRDALRSVHLQGVCPEPDWPYLEAQYATVPSVIAKRAAVLPIIEYQRVEADIDRIRHCLHEGLPVILGLDLFEDVTTGLAKATGMVPMPTTEALGGQVIAGHAVVLVGYDDDPHARRFLFRNSWGAAWGIGGYGWLPYEFVFKLATALDLWVMRLPQTRGDMQAAGCFG